MSKIISSVVKKYYNTSVFDFATTYDFSVCLFCPKALDKISHTIWSELLQFAAYMHSILEYEK